MKKFLLYGHGGSYNHGAEAIIRTTVQLIREKYPNSNIILSSNFAEQDLEYGLDKIVDEIIQADLSYVLEEKSAEGYENKVDYAKKIYAKALHKIDKETICLSVGGDNYCYPNWHRQSVFNCKARECGAKSILWACSIQPEMMNEKMVEVLSEHDYIFARDSLTYDALLKHNIFNVSIVKDPAFNLIPEYVDLPKGFDIKKTVGINISPLVLRKNRQVMSDFVQASRSMLETAGSLVMIPHVVMEVDNDRDALNEFMQYFSEEERKRILCLPEKLNASQLKYVISQCSMLICCRTHASIAGYSTGTPTLVVGYSVKSRGIAKDLNCEEWVLQFDESSQLSNITNKMWNMFVDR